VLPSGRLRTASKGVGVASQGVKASLPQLWVHRWRWRRVRTLVQTAKIGLVATSLAMGLAGCPTGPEDSAPTVAAQARTPAKKLQGMQAAFPSAQVDAVPGGVTRIYGATLATGAAPADSAVPKGLRGSHGR